MSQYDYAVIGKTGLIGRSVSRYLKAQNLKYYAVSRNMKDQHYLDLANDFSSNMLAKAKVAILCAGVTSVKECELNQEYTDLVNVTNQIKLVKYYNAHGARVIYLSTDLVFENSLGICSFEDQVTCKTVYAQQKYEVEKVVLGLGHTVLRLGKVIGPDHELFHGWLEDLKLGNHIKSFKNHYFSPVWLNDVVKCILKLIDYSGLWQYSSDASISYSDAVYYLASKCGADLNLIERKFANAELFNIHKPFYMETNLPDKRIDVSVPTPQDVLDLYLKEVGGRF